VWVKELVRRSENIVGFFRLKEPHLEIVETHQLDVFQERSPKG
jgi:hypothetical protein